MHRHQSLQSWHKEHVDTPSGPAAQCARWHKTLATFDLSAVYAPGKDNGDTEETTKAKRIIKAECLLKKGEAKCFVLRGSRAELAQDRDAKAQAVEAQMKEEDVVRAIEGVKSVSIEDWSDDCANWGH